MAMAASRGWAISARRHSGRAYSITTANALDTVSGR